MRDNFKWNPAVKNEKVGKLKNLLNKLNKIRFEKLRIFLFQNKKILFVILGLLIILRIFISYLNNNRDYSPTTDGIETLDSSDEINQSSNNRTDGVGISEVTPPLIYESTSDGVLKNNIKPSFTVSGPVITNDAHGYVWYSYNIRLNESASIKYKDGFEYVLGPGNCTDKSFFYYDSDPLSGILDNPSLGDNTIIVKVESIFLDYNTTDSIYEIKDKEGNVIGEGDVSIPDCKSIIDSSEDGKSIKVDGPVITDSNDRVGYSTIKYHFIPDEEALNTLEKGFSFKIYDEGCKDWLSEDPFNKTYEEGKVGYIGTTFELDNDAFDTNNSLRRSIYEITDFEGALLFRGFIDVPNCR